MNVKIILILPYFGKFKDDFFFWLKSIEKNPTVDLLIVTDQHIVETLPFNVRVVEMKFEECVTLFQNKFDFEILNLTPYKLCDFKPAYGYIFQEYINEYNFWGHCDCDLILGDIRFFITDEILNCYDHILSRGHLTLYRNTKDVNLSFMKAVPSYKEVFVSEDVWHFDEHPGTGNYWFKHRTDKIYDEILFDDLNWMKFNFEDVHKWNTIDQNRTHFVYSYENGKLYRCFLENRKVGREEILYVHFQKRFMKVLTPVSDYFTILPNKYVSFVQLNEDFLKKNVCNRILYTPIHYFQVKLKALMRRMYLWRRNYFTC